jgi:UDP:flavonoid glycosyltransferase YjiC (YdhE family)
MKLGFICLNLPGHLNPMTALARYLQDRNHDVVFLYSSGSLRGSSQGIGLTIARVLFIAWRLLGKRR